MVVPRMGQKSRVVRRRWLRQRRSALLATLLALTVYWMRLLAIRLDCSISTIPPPLPSLHTRRSWTRLDKVSSIESLCHACLQNSTTPCSANLAAIVQSKGTWKQRLSQIAQAFKDCECNQKCTPDEQRYWRLDAAGPAEYYSTSHMLQAIPEQHRLPEKATHNLGAYFEHNPSAAYPEKVYLFEYNPTVVVLPSVVPTTPEAVYLASYRVTAFQYCFKDKHARKVFNLKDTYPADAPPLEGLVALALLRSDLSVIQDIVIDVRKVFPKMQDPRLFVLHEQIYLASYEFIVPLWLEPQQHDTVELVDFWNPSKKMAVHMRSYASCCTAPTCQGGKNFNYFTAQGETWVETNPMQPRVVEQVDLTRPCQETGKQLTVFQHTDPPPAPSFFAADALLSRVLPGAFSEERGTACCIPLEHPDTKEKVLVGISHAKSKRVEGWQNILTGRQYASKFYAFSAQAPFRLQSISGSFCLRFANDPENNYFQPLAANQAYRLGEEQDCPKISFPTGLIDLSDEYALLSYGINDCTGRMMIVSKNEVANILWNPQSRS